MIVTFSFSAVNPPVTLLDCLNGALFHARNIEAQEPASYSTDCAGSIIGLLELSIKRVEEENKDFEVYPEP